MFRLRHFVRNILIPELEFWKRAVSEKDVRSIVMFRAAVFEAFLWLRLGVEIGYFSRLEGDAVVASYLTARV